MFSALTEIYMTRGFQRFTTRYAILTGALIGLAVVSSILLHSGCGMTSSPRIPTPTPTPDTVRPTSTITSPTAGATILIGTQVAITGTASDTGGGSVVRVEVSVDGGATFSAATGTNTWSFNWTSSAAGQATIRSRAVDNSGNVQDPPTEIRVEVDAPPTSTITFPTEGATITLVPPIAITGTASDAGGGSVVRVEVSVNGGGTFSAATGTNAWSFNWTPSAPGPVTIRSRAVDNTGNVQNPPAEIHVTRGPTTFRVPSDRPTIQSAINDATDGDTVLVAPGTYVENINFGGKAIAVTSESGAQSTIIDGGAADPVVIFTLGEGRDSVLNGFTLQNGRAGFDNQGLGEGGGIKVQGSSPTITNNVIRNNQACNGGGIGIGSSSPLIRLNTITSNRSISCFAGLGGGGIIIRGTGSAEILDNVISDNVNLDGGGIYMLGAGTPIFKRNIIKGNNALGHRGGGIYMENISNALIVQNIIVGNQARAGGGLFWLVPQGSRGPRLVNNTIADNNATELGSGIFAEGFDDQVELTNNIIVAKPGQSGLYCGFSNDRNPPIIRFNNIYSVGGRAYGGNCSDMTGTNGNISADPLFTNPTQDDYNLQPGSFSIDAGDNQAPDLPDTDRDGDLRIMDGDGNGIATIDMGVDEFLLPPGFTLPTSRITFPIEGRVVLIGTTITITGLARDSGGGTVARVDVSVDDGVTWSAATGTTAWSYNWTPVTPGPVTIRSRAVDDSGNQQDPPAAVAVTGAVPIRVPSDQPTIQSAIDAANNGHMVLVAPGTYHEHIDFKGKAITVTSESGPEITIIDGGNTASVVRFTSEERRDSVINGFTLQNGGTNAAGGGIVIHRSSPTITNNVIRNNHACEGGGISIGDGSPLVQQNTITGNGPGLCGGGTAGGGISIVGFGSAEILDNVISDNESLFGGGIELFTGLPTGGPLIIKRNIIKGNNSVAGQGGGIRMSGFLDALIVQNLITDNQAFEGGGIYWFVNGGARGPRLVNNTIADNNATNGSGIFAEGDDVRTELTNNIIVAKPGQTGLHCSPIFGHHEPIIRFNNIFSAGGTAYGGTCSDKTGMDGNISADPLFTNPTQGDFHIQQGSPSIDAGDNLTPNLPDTDIDGDPRILDGDGDGTATVDMGVDEFLAPALRSVFRMRATVISSRSPTNGQLPFTRYEEITLIEGRLKKAAALSYVSSQIRKRHCGQEHETIPVHVPAHRSAYLPA